MDCPPGGGVSSHSSVPHHAADRDGLLEVSQTQTSIPKACSTAGASLVMPPTDPSETNPPSSSLIASFHCHSCFGVGGPAHRCVWFFQFVCFTFRHLWGRFLFGAHVYEPASVSHTNSLVVNTCPCAEQEAHHAGKGVRGVDRGPSCVFFCWTDLTAFWWSNYKDRATGSSGMVNELQIIAEKVLIWCSADPPPAQWSLSAHSLFSC